MTKPDVGRLRWQLLFANLAVAAAGMGAVAVGVWLAAPRAFESAMGTGGMMGPGGMMGTPGASFGVGPGGMMDPTLRAAFGNAVGTGVLLGLVAAGVVAVVVALLLSARIARPVTLLAEASSRIALGDYSGRVAPATGEIGDLAQSFNEMATALEANEQRRRDLIGDVAHELRTPIASVRGYVEGLEAGVIPAGPDAWRVLGEQTARLAHLVDDLSLLWQADSRDLRLHVKALDGPTLLADALERHRALAAERGVSLTLGDVSPRIVRADPMRIGQVLDNLVGNALQYTPAGGHVELDITDAGSTTILTIRDDGPGLTREQAGRVFDRFYRTDASRSREAGGSGLGLAISRSLVEAMGGSIDASSPGPGSGSTFLVRLPRA